MVDALASGASGGNPVEVQVLSSVPIRSDLPTFLPTFVPTCLATNYASLVTIQGRTTGFVDISGVTRRLYRNFRQYLPNGVVIYYTQGQNEEFEVISHAISMNIFCVQWDPSEKNWDTQRRYYVRQCFIGIRGLSYRIIHKGRTAKPKS